MQGFPVWSYVKQFIALFFALTFSVSDEVNREGAEKAWIQISQRG